MWNRGGECPQQFTRITGFPAVNPGDALVGVAAEATAAESVCVPASFPASFPGGAKTPANPKSKTNEATHLSIVQECR